MNPYLQEILHNITTRLAKLEEQQADRIAELEKETEECWCGGHSYEYLRAKNRLPQTKPLSDEEIVEIFRFSDVASNYYRDTEKFAIEFARAIEAKVRGKK
jgi:hypothetical protein